ncbi:MAG: sialidase family protein, partial [Bacteroidota bacterium]
MSNNQRKLLLSTNKGLVIFERTPAGWRFEKDVFMGLPVSTAFVDPRDGTWWACLAHRHWGTKLQRSTDGGQNWQEVPAPRYPADAQLKSGKSATLRYVWIMTHAGADRPGELYLGTEPGGLFVSKDGGDHFELLHSLWNHPSRKDEWFGAGRDEPYIHSIVVDPRDSQHFYIAVSCAGVFETTDNGLHWTVRNEGLRADFLPEPYAKIGHDPHLMLACASQPDVLWQQNHCGVFRSTDGAVTWQEITDREGLAVYGFALGIDHDDPERAWVIPAISDEMRMAIDRSLCVCRTEDGGKSWQALRKGLPQGNCYDLVLRHALAVHNNVLAFGTTNGN